MFADQCCLSLPRNSIHRYVCTLNHSVGWSEQESHIVFGESFDEARERVFVMPVWAGQQFLCTRKTTCDSEWDPLVARATWFEAWMSLTWRHYWSGSKDDQWFWWMKNSCNKHTTILFCNTEIRTTCVLPTVNLCVVTWRMHMNQNIWNVTACHSAEEVFCREHCVDERNVTFVCWYIHILHCKSLCVKGQDNPESSVSVSMIVNFLCYAVSMIKFVQLKVHVATSAKRVVFLFYEW